ncbi:MAG: glycosyl transferase family 2 [Jatrophihabitantaceae bacterium]|nr:glycosyl transferase family 2 [Jatrophihabitantaceae bacterium]
MQSTSFAQGVVSVVVLNYRGAQEAIECLRGLVDMDWPVGRLELICVDNASGDGSAETIRAAAIPGVRVIESPVNSGFAGGCNFGAAQARGEYIAFINPDARPDRNWVRAAIEAMSYDRGIACVASRVLDWSGERIDYVGGGLTFYGMGYKREAERPAAGVGLAAKDVLFPTGAAMIARASVFAAVGGFDEQYFMFYEDVDLGWRLNLLGHRVRYVPESVAFHRHHTSISKFGSYRERYLLERNALLTILKNYERSTLDAVLAPSLLLSIARSMSLGGADIAALDLQRTNGGDESPTLEVDKLALTGPFALAYIAEHLGELMAQRAEIQSRRTHADASLARLFEDALEPIHDDPHYLATFRAALKSFPIAASLGSRRKVLVITADILSDRMAGPAIRAFNIASVLSMDHEVRLVSTSACTVESADFLCQRIPSERLFPAVDWADIVVFQGFVMHFAPWIADTDKIVVADIYDPMHLEQLEQVEDDDPITRARVIASTTSVLNNQLLRADFFICASEAQRKFWLGQLAGLGRINPANYERDSSLRSLIDICPFGLPAQPPTRTRPAIKGVVPGISVSDKVIIWAGGVYNWFDPLTLVHAVNALRERHPDVRLFFLGMKHPNPDVPDMRMAYETRMLSDALGLTGRHVFFNEGWVDYDDRQNYLMDSDVGVSTHFEHVETTFSFRTRILDYLWTGLPIVATGGDSFGDMLDSEGIGTSVPERDIDALTAALERALYDDEFAESCRERIAAVRQRFVWERALAPLVDFCRHAVPAADRTGVFLEPTHDGRPILPADVAGSVIRRNVYYARQRLSEGGVTNVVRRGARKGARLVRSRMPD